MSAPNLSANVPPGQRFRVVYRLTSPIASLFTGAPEAITNAWYSSPAYIVLSPATQPDVGGTTRITGPNEAFCSIDGKAPLATPTVTWDEYLKQIRSPSLGLLGLGVSVELYSVELLTAADLSSTTAPAARSKATQTPATTSKLTSPTLGGLVSTATNRLLLAGAIVLAIVVAWKMGPQIMTAAKKMAPQLLATVKGRAA